jgi:hypothetical protein
MKTAKEARRGERSSASGSIEAVAYSPDGKTVATTGMGHIYPGPGYGNLGGQFGLQGGQFGNFGGQFGLQGGQFGNFGSPFGFQGANGQFGNLGGQFGLQGGNRQIVLWEVATGKQRGSWAEAGKTVSFAADGKMLILGIKDNKVLLQSLSAVRIVPPSKTWVRPTDTDAVWVELMGENADRAYLAVWVLAAAPERALPVLRERVRPAAPPLERRLIDRWIVELDSAQFADRQRATVELEGVGGQAEKALREVLKERPFLELTKRVERLLVRLQGLAPETVRASRVIEALEQMHTPAAHQFLEALAGGLPDAALTAEAEAALARLGKRAAAQ